MILALCWFKQAFAWFGFHALLWKTLLARFAVAWRHRGVEISEIVWCWFCVEMVASLRCWFCDITAFTQSLIHVCYLSQPVLRWDSSGPSFRRWWASFELQARFKRVKRERAHTARCFKLSGFGHRPQAAGPIRASVRGGAPPARLLLQGTFMWRKITFFYPCIKKSYQVYTFIISPHSLSYWFIHFCNRSYKSKHNPQPTHLLCFTEGIGCAAPGCEHWAQQYRWTDCTVSLARFRLYELNKHKFVFNYLVDL